MSISVSPYRFRSEVIEEPPSCPSAFNKKDNILDPESSLYNRYLELKSQIVRDHLQGSTPFSIKSSEGVKDHRKEIENKLRQQLKLQNDKEIKLFDSKVRDLIDDIISTYELFTSLRWKKIITDCTFQEISSASIPEDAVLYYQISDDIKVIFDGVSLKGKFKDSQEFLSIELPEKSLKKICHDEINFKIMLSMRRVPANANGTISIWIPVHICVFSKKEIEKQLDEQKIPSNDVDGWEFEAYSNGSGKMVFREMVLNDHILKILTLQLKYRIQNGDLENINNFVIIDGKTIKMLALKPLKGAVYEDSFSQKKRAQRLIHSIQILESENRELMSKLFGNRDQIRSLEKELNVLFPIGDPFKHEIDEYKD